MSVNCHNPPIMGYHIYGFPHFTSVTLSLIGCTHSTIPECTFHPLRVTTYTDFHISHLYHTQSHMLHVNIHLLIYISLYPERNMLKLVEVMQFLAANHPVSTLPPARFLSEVQYLCGSLINSSPVDLTKTREFCAEVHSLLKQSQSYPCKEFVTSSYI